MPGKYFFSVINLQVQVCFVSVNYWNDTYCDDRHQIAHEKSFDSEPEKNIIKLWRNEYILFPEQ